MNNLWKPAVLAAYCNRVRAGSTLSDSGPLGRHVLLPQAGVWSQIAGHNDRWAIERASGDQGGWVPFDPSLYSGITITAWVYRSDASVRYLCGIRTASNTGFQIWVDSSNRLTTTNFSGGSPVQTPGALTTGQWHHIAVRMSATNTDQFINGALRGNAINSPINTSGVTSLGILGARSFWQSAGGAVGSSGMDKAADICIWPSVLEGSDIAWLANPANNVVQLPSGQSPHLIAPSLSHGVVG